MTPCQLIQMDDRADQVELSASPGEGRYEISMRSSNIRYCVFVSTACTVPEGWNGLVYKNPFLWDDVVSTCSQNPMFRDNVGHSPSKGRNKILIGKFRPLNIRPNLCLKTLRSDYTLMEVLIPESLPNFCVKLKTGAPNVLVILYYPGISGGLTACMSLKVKVKGRFMGLFNTAAVRPILFLPSSSRIHLQRRHASYRCARPLPAKAGTITNEFC